MMPRPASPATGLGPIEVLIVDDSAVVRQILKTIIESDPRFRVTVAADPFDAVEKLKKSVPGVILLDVEMPRMDGLTFLKKLMSQHPLPVVLCTSVPERAVKALEMGAVEVIAKPNFSDQARMVSWSRSFMESVTNAARLSKTPIRDDRPAATADGFSTADGIIARAAYVNRGVATERIVAVGVSTGGPQALPRLLSGFPKESPGIVIVQHLPAEFFQALADRLNNDPKINIEVAVARHMEPIRPGRAVFIPGDVHGIVRRVGTGYRVEFVEGPKVKGHAPSVEVLFRSVAQSAGPNAAGVIMTGMQDDGASALLEMREAGAMTVAQDEATCAVFGMPREAIRRGAAKFVVPLDRIAASVMAWHLGADGGSWH